MFEIFFGGGSLEYRWVEGGGRVVVVLLKKTGRKVVGDCAKKVSRER
jgi:hypothetical protein